MIYAFEIKQSKKKKNWKKKSSLSVSGFDMTI